MRKLLIYLLVFTLTGCTTTPLKVKKNQLVDSIQLCFNFDEDIEGDDRLRILGTAKMFIDKFNSQKRNFTLIGCQKGESKTVFINVLSTDYVSPDKQAFYTVISALGIGYLLSGAGFGFAWFGLNSSNLQVSVTEDLNNNGKPIFRHLVSSPYYHGMEGVRERHMQRIEEYLFELFEQMGEEKAL